MAQPLSIAHIDTALTFRGGQEALILLARCLRERGHRQIIVTPPDSKLSERARAEGLTVEPLGSVTKLRRLLRGFDIVHAHSGRAQTLSFFATTGLAVRRAVTRNVAFEARHPRIHFLKYTLTCHGIVAVSRAARTALLDAGVAAGRIEVIHNGVEWPSRTATPEERGMARRRFGLYEDDFVAGHLGAFTQEKGQEVAVQAAALLRESLPGLRLLLGGEGPLREAAQMQEQVRLSQGRVILPGQVHDRASFFAALDLFLMPSRSEAWGLAALEAMAHGVPVIASDTGGLREIVVPGEGGWLVEPGNPRALADAIARAAFNPGELRAAGASARERARQFSAEDAAERMEAFYRRLLSRS